MSEDAGAELRQAALHGVRWISIARLVAETAALASSVVLARLIPPAEFGHAAVALVVVALAVIIGPAGVTAHVVQRRSLDAEHLEGAAFLSLAAGSLLTGLTIAFAQTVGASIFGAETARLLTLASAAWTITAVGAVSQAVLQRDLRFRRIALVDSISVLAGTGVAVTLAVLGADATALVAGALVTAAAATILAVTGSRPVRPRASRRGVAEVGGFAASVSLSSLVYSVFRNVDYAILGARLSAAQVGYYYRAYQLGVDYQSKLSQIMLRISFPVYSRSQSLEELRRLRMRIVRVHATVLVPLLGAFVALAPLAVPWVFGAAWKPAVVPAQIMAVAGVSNALTTGTGPLMVAIGRPGALLVWSVCELVLYAALILVLAPHGLTVVAIGVAGFGIFVVVVNQAALLGPFVGLSTRSFVLETLPGLVAGGAVLGALVGVREAASGIGVPTPVRLVALAALGLGVYVLVLRSLFREVWSDLLSLGRRLGTRRTLRTEGVALDGRG